MLRCEQTPLRCLSRRRRALGTGVFVACRPSTCCLCLLRAFTTRPPNGHIPRESTRRQPKACSPGARRDRVLAGGAGTRKEARQQDLPAYINLNPRGPPAKNCAKYCRGESRPFSVAEGRDVTLLLRPSRSARCPHVVRSRCAPREEERRTHRERERSGAGRRRRRTSLWMHAGPRQRGISGA